MQRSYMQLTVYVKLVRLAQLQKQWTGKIESSSPRLTIYFSDA